MVLLLNPILFQEPSSVFVEMYEHVFHIENSGHGHIPVIEIKKGAVLVQLRCTSYHPREKTQRFMRKVDNIVNKHAHWKHPSRS
jgi:hypothetical protein